MHRPPLILARSLGLLPSLQSYLQLPGGTLYLAGILSNLSPELMTGLTRGVNLDDAGSSVCSYQ